MRTVKQPEGSALCVAACVAMILDFESVSDLLHWGIREVGIHLSDVHPPFQHYFTDPRCLTLSQALKLLATRDMIVGVWCTPYTPVKDTQTSWITEIDLMTTDALLTVRSESFSNLRHMVVWDHADGRVVRDPSPKCGEYRMISDYEILEIFPVASLKDDTQ